MKPSDESPWKYIVLWLRIVFGVHLLYSGLAYAIGGWIPPDVQKNLDPAEHFIVMLNNVGLYPWVKYQEIVAGAMLVANYAVPLALVIELPITIVIFYLNVLVNASGRHLYTGPQELFLNVSLLLAYGGYYANFLRTQTRPWWLWDGFADLKPKIDD